MNILFDYLTEDQNIQLPLVRGGIVLERTQGSGLIRLTRQLSIAPLGKIGLQSGKLLVGDAFQQGFSSTNNPWINTPSGIFDVFNSFSFQKTLEHKIKNIKNNYISIVFNQEKIQKRIKNDTLNLTSGIPPLFESRMEKLEKKVPSEFYSEGEIQVLKKTHFMGISGTGLIVDKENFESLMPFSLDGNEWLETVFEHGVNHSWFDAIDEDVYLTKGFANQPLPLGEKHKNVVLFPIKQGKVNNVWGEYDLEDEMIALHLELNIKSDF